MHEVEIEDFNGSVCQIPLNRASRIIIMHVLHLYLDKSQPKYLMEQRLQSCEKSKSTLLGHICAIHLREGLAHQVANFLMPTRVQVP